MLHRQERDTTVERIIRVYRHMHRDGKLIPDCGNLDSACRISIPADSRTSHLRVYPHGQTMRAAAGLQGQYWDRLEGASGHVHVE